MVTQVGGQFRLVHRDANDNVIGEREEKHSSEFGTGTAALTDPQLMPKLAADPTPLREDDKLTLMFKPDAAYTASATADVLTIRIPVRFKNLRTGKVFSKTLTALDFESADKYMPAATAMSAGVWYDVDSYIIPAQSEIKLGTIAPDDRTASALNLHIADAA